MSRFWVWIGRSSGMPREVRKQDFEPITYLAGDGDWIQFVREKEMRALQQATREWLEAEDRAIAGEPVNGKDPNEYYDFLAVACEAMERVRKLLETPGG